MHKERSRQGLQVSAGTAVRLTVRPALRPSDCPTAMRSHARADRWSAGSIDNEGVVPAVNEGRWPWRPQTADHLISFRALQAVRCAAVKVDAWTPGSAVRGAGAPAGCVSVCAMTTRTMGLVECGGAWAVGSGRHRQPEGLNHCPVSNRKTSNLLIFHSPTFIAPSGHACQVGRLPRPAAGHGAVG
jgi:hypothetical protein